MWQMLQADKPDDYILATGETHSVREFIEESFAVFNEEILWEGKKENEFGVLKSTGKTVVNVNPRFYRPTEVELLIGSPSKAKEKLGWSPKVKFNELVRIMVESDYKKIKERNS
jgi:GDPmannose 4,6-dehydratase